MMAVWNRIVLSNMPFCEVDRLIIKLESMRGLPLLTNFLLIGLEYQEGFLVFYVGVVFLSWL